eukprot:GHUV01008881.1.p1 GENE.GHUV01008881.1~~GHUV01008881.1.p1  ORF type:complete len:115 (+),score=29.63 GHUV01008881.1:455-799(+)
MAPPKKKTKTLQQPLDVSMAAVSPSAQVAGPEVSLSALQQLEEKKKGISRQLKQVESQIYDLETRYLEGCNPAANALKGYEGLRSLVGNSKPGKASPIDPADRIFSGSSTTAGR